MRSATKTFVGLAGIGVLVATAKLGLPTASATASTIATTTGTTSSTSETTATPTTTPTTSTTTATKTATKTTTKKSTKASTSTSSSTSTATPTPTPTPTASSTSQTSSAVRYRFGTVQVKVTKKGGNITAVDYLNSSATNGRQGAFPSLVSAAISANGSNFGNLGGATYTTDAFKQALDSALAKF